jgi:Fur family ferric uptake transcriptional regulator/Fur family peroxide stress response transcriptional regulator
MPTTTKTDLDQSAIDRRLVAELRARNLRVTSQRLLIHRALCARSQHLTAEQVLASVSEVLPGVSLPTVYATLELLEELGLARRLATGNGAVLFDSRVEPHAHTVCRRCGATADLETSPAPDGALSRARGGGFVPDHAQLVIWGTCERCAAAGELAA